MPKRFLNSYQYYTNYFIPVFLLSLYRYQSICQIPALIRSTFLLNLFYRRSAVAFFHAFGLLFMTFLQFPQKFYRLAKSRPYQWQYRYFPSARVKWDLYTKIIWFLLGKVLKGPLKAQPQGNAFYQYTIRTLRTPEIHYYDLQIYDQGLLGFLTLQFCFSKPVRTVWEETNLLRMWNIPLFRQK